MSEQTLEQRESSSERDARLVREQYQHDANGRITQPGKFEGEPIFVPYYWDVAMNGFADSDDGKVFGFRFTAAGDDFEVWPELKRWLGRKRSMKLYEDSQGFVHAS